MTNPGINVILKTTRTFGKPKCVNMCPGRVNLTCGGHAPAVESTARSNTAHVRHANRVLRHTEIVKGEYCYVVKDHCIDHKTFESISSIFRVYNLDQQAF